MTTLSHALDASTNAKRFATGSAGRTRAYVMVIIGTVTLFLFAMLSGSHFAPSGIVTHVESKPMAGVSDNGYHFGDNAADAQAAREAAAKVLARRAMGL
jgi:hypothetical protein